MRILLLSALVLLSACATTPRPAEGEAGPSLPPRTEPIIRDPAGLVGLTATQLIGKLGAPALQIREGQSLKLQFRNDRCVVDTYLYAAARGQPERVEHVDTRAPSGVRANEQTCVDLFQSRAN